MKLIGGLGNQLFQYAAGRALAIRNNTALFLDLSHLNKDPQGAYTPRFFELDKFNICAQIATAAELSHFNFNSGRINIKLKSLAPGLFRDLIFNESQQEFDPRFLKLPATTYLNGYWQDERYFLNIRPQLLQELSLQQESEAYKNYIQIIRSANAVSLHVRRGDYISLPSASNFHGTPGMDYYRKAIALLEREQTGLHYFIFSDDVAWCEQQFAFLPAKTLISGKALTAQEELLLMSHCRHHIIANSSFSWWGAWLNTRADKKVIAPEYWFAGKKSSQLSILPKEWLIMV